MFLSGTERHNFPRFRGRGPFYEVYYLRFTDPRQRIAVWYRETILAPAGGTAEAALWFMLFDLADPARSVAVKKQEPLARARLERDIFYFEVAGGKLYHRGSDGAIAVEGTPIEWRFSWEPARKPFLHFPSRLLYHTPFPKTKLLSPNPDLKVSGQLRLGERRFEFDRVPGQQSHLWGKSHAASWAWGQVNSFAGEEAFFEGLAASVPVRGRLVGPLTLLRVVVGGKEYRLNSPWQWRKNLSHAGLDRWHFEGGGRKVRIVGDVFVDPGELLGVTYTDPDGSKRYCYHTESARLELKLYRRHGDGESLLRRLESDPAMAYEFAVSEPLPDIPLRL